MSLVPSGSKTRHSWGITIASTTALSSSTSPNPMCPVAHHRSLLVHLRENVHHAKNTQQNKNNKQGFFTNIRTTPRGIGHDAVNDTKNNTSSNKSFLRPSMNRTRWTHEDKMSMISEISSRKNRYSRSSLVVLCCRVDQEEKSVKVIDFKILDVTQDNHFPTDAGQSFGVCHLKRLSRRSMKQFQERRHGVLIRFMKVFPLLLVTACGGSVVMPSANAGHAFDGAAKPIHFLVGRSGPRMGKFTSRQSLLETKNEMSSGH